MPQLTRCKHALSAITGVALAFTAQALFAQAYPAKPIEVTVHTSAGSGGDLVSRTVAEIIRREKILPQMLLVNNRVGGAGITAFNYFQTKKGDPYQILSVTGTILAMAYRPDTNIPLSNYTPIALMAVDPQTIMVPANSPYKSVKELIEAARKSPDGLVAATTSVSGTGRLLIHLLEKNAPGVKFRFVNFKGGADAVTSTAGGHTHFTTENLGEGLGFVEGKQLRVLAISAERRLPQAPDVPTLQELGLPITAGTIRGFTFTAGVPKEAVTTMEQAFEKVHNSSAWKELAKRSIFQDTFMGSAEFTKFLAVRMEEYRVFYDAIGLGKAK